MSFISPLFYVVLLGLLAVWPLLRWQGVRIWALLLFSWLIYATWSWWFFALLLYVTGVSYLWVRLLQRTQDAKWWFFWLGVGLTLVPLITYKWHLGGAGQGVGHGLLLPVGLSFYTFQALSMVIDAYRGTAPQVKKWSHYALFIAFFPQVLAGPILRGQAFWPQLVKPLRVTGEGIQAALMFVTTGLFLKLVLADHLAIFQNTVFATPEVFHPVTIWLAVLVSMWRFVADFGGYALIAIGLGRLFGITLPHNFGPWWQARTPRAFWQHWHITLTRWLMDYVFMPLYRRLGKHGLALTVAYVVTFGLMGLWHGSHWFLAGWGLAFGVQALAYHFMAPWFGRMMPVPMLGWLFFQLQMALFGSALILGQTKLALPVLQALTTPLTTGVLWLPPVTMASVGGIIIFVLLHWCWPRGVNPLQLRWSSWAGQAYFYGMWGLILLFGAPRVSPFLYFHY